MQVSAPKWLIRQEIPVVDEDLTADGAVSLLAVERWFTTVAAAYLDRCKSLHREPSLALNLRLDAPLDPAPLGRPTKVVASASASQLRPDALTIELRVRPVGPNAGARIGNLCVVTLLNTATCLPQPMDAVIRAELLALERAARHNN
ncbi:hypothetical protein F0L68_28915 [Solihabitans fulvus]|uniref:Thioesterase domain-containing protein n=1 Tax=Solihabitans fulvus TaxID=1892852 RepID=A0A5B2WT79_9PSEU|nr:hypothetical protein [Solihabitans fulvus]KAA2255243.1 hypothetical protein F0L68_28915 [Solihabitans fulvus]